MVHMNVQEQFMPMHYQYFRARKASGSELLILKRIMEQGKSLDLLSESLVSMCTLLDDAVLVNIIFNSSSVV